MSSERAPGLCSFCLRTGFLPCPLLDGTCLLALGEGLLGSSGPFRETSIRAFVIQPVENVRSDPRFQVLLKKMNLSWPSIARAGTHWLVRRRGCSDVLCSDCRPHDWRVSCSHSGVDPFAKHRAGVLTRSLCRGDWRIERRWGNPRANASRNRSQLHLISSRGLVPSRCSRATGRSDIHPPRLPSGSSSQRSMREYVRLSPHGSRHRVSSRCRAAADFIDCHSRRQHDVKAF